MAYLSGQPHDAPNMGIECGVTLLERRGALLESRFYDQRDDRAKVWLAQRVIVMANKVPNWLRLR